jgi:hypothetical protein
MIRQEVSPMAKHVSQMTTDHETIRQWAEKRDEQ